MRLPWPPKELSPNARCHWAVKARAAKAYRETVFWTVKGEAMMRPDGPAVLSLVFHPPSRRRIDDDNLVGRFKAGRDGLADALDIDDSQLSLLVKIGKPVKGGAVEVEILPPLGVTAPAS
jgi:crossover junction endodeoxyribonuclease RusA